MTGQPIALARQRNVSGYPIINYTGQHELSEPWQREQEVALLSHLQYAATEKGETTMPNLTSQLRTEYQTLFDTCAIRPERKNLVDPLVSSLLQNKSRYQAVGDQTDVPWYIIAVIHNMEASQSFKKHLHNGDPLTARTVHVPAGRPLIGNPPFKWEDSAIDALVVEDFDRVEDWTLPGSLFQLEKFNGFGSRNRRIHTPYLWSFSNQYTKGKFVADGVFDANAVSQQCGAAVLLRGMMDKQAFQFPLNIAPSTVDEIKAAGAAVQFSNNTKTIQATRLQKLLNRFPGVSARLTPDGFPGGGTSAAFKAVTGSFLTGDPRA
jgi:lysozyme family protein